MMTMHAYTVTAVPIVIKPQVSKCQSGAPQECPYIPEINDCEMVKFVYAHTQTYQQYILSLLL